MWLPVSTIAALCVFFDFSESAPSDNELELIFKDRSHNDWKEAWHKERYTRCREKLIKHLYWACEKDIYRLTRRNEKKSLDNYNFDYYNRETYPWIDRRKARVLLRTKRGIDRRSGPSITAECCKSTGCTWEEYAEYCPTNKRYNSFVK